MIAALLATLSSAIWGTADFYGGLAARRWPAVAVVGCTQTAGLLSVLCTAVLFGHFGGPRGWIVWAVIAGSVGAVGLVTFYVALSVGTMGVVSPLAALGAVVPVIGGLLNGDRPSALQYVGMAFGLAGAVTASGPELRGVSRVGARSVGLAALAGLCFGVALLGIQRGAQTNPLMTLVGMRAVSVAFFVVVAVAKRSVGGIRPADLPVLALIGIGDAGANLLYSIASGEGMTSTVAVLGALYPVATVLLAAMFLKEWMKPVQRVGVALALAGVVLLALA